MRRTAIALALVLLTRFAAGAEPGELQFADIGDLRLESGAVLHDCRVGYRTWGTLDLDRSNVVVITSWFSGTSEALRGVIGPAALFDDRRWFVIAFDALGNGISTSPSNSVRQPGRSFPRITVGDMVRSQHTALTRVLGLERVHAVSGLSMGGMQAFEWAYRFPDFMNRIIPIVGTPKQTSHDLLFWSTQLDLLEAAETAEARRAAMRLAARMNTLEIRTPQWLVANVPPEELPEMIRQREERVGRIDPDDYAAQLRAMIDLDIYRRFGGSAAKAAAALKPRTLIVVAAQDQTVRPEPSRELARLARARLLVLSGECGHLATACEQELLSREVRAFLAE